MLAEDIVWKEEYALGVPSIDEQHQELFNIARRIFIVCQQNKRHEWAGEEGIKFLKSYCLRHFSNEEAYMRSINYPDIEKHMVQHSLLRDKVVPRIEAKLRFNKFSPEYMEKFLNIIQLWLGRHIMEHDLAIGRWRAMVEE